MEVLHGGPGASKLVKNVPEDLPRGLLVGSRLPTGRHLWGLYHLRGLRHPQGLRPGLKAGLPALDLPVFQRCVACGRDRAGGSLSEAHRQLTGDSEAVPVR